MKTMILFLSTYDKDRNPEPVEYSTDCPFTVHGAQTNEAPVKYAIERLKRRTPSEVLGKVIALTTPTAYKTAYEHFCTEIEKCSPLTDIIKIDIPDNVTTTELLQRTLEEMLPTLEAPDTVIIETTGGYRNAVIALTLLARFLRYRGIAIEFSTYSDLQQKYVSDTKETDNLLDMLDAVNIFTTLGNPQPLIRVLEDIKKIPEITTFMKSIEHFYDIMLCCKMSKLDNTIDKLRTAIGGILDADFKKDNPKLLVFSELVRNLIHEKMRFIFEDNYLMSLVRWCCDNGYLQQALTILVERILSQPIKIKRDGKERKERRKSVAGESIPHNIYIRLIRYRNGFNHADGSEIDAKADYICESIITVLKMLNDFEEGRK